MHSSLQVPAGLLLRAGVSVVFSECGADCKYSSAYCIKEETNEKKTQSSVSSGGPTAVINASLCGVVQEALNHEEACGTVYGMINGIEGLLNGTVMDMKPLRSSGELELIRTTPGRLPGFMQIQTS